MNDQIPLYVGIPLALLCIAVTGFAVMFMVTLWMERKR